MEEATLLRRARQFEEAALAEIYDIFSPALYAYAMRLTGDPQIADDCVAEVFSRFLGALRDGRGPDQYLKAYLYRIAHNWITDLYRRGRPQTSLDPEMHAGEAVEPHFQTAQALERRTLRAALEQLTAEQRQVIALKYLEELDNAEIAEALQKPVGAVKALQHRALASLRRILEAEAEEDTLGAPSLGVG